jgi:FtsH-binding integral membrane protein
MSTRDPKHAEPPSDEQLFIQRAIASVEKAEKYSKIKRIVQGVALFAVAFWFAFRPSGPELKIQIPIIMFVGVIVGFCTTKILVLINKNTKDILQAISARRQL